MCVTGVLVGESGPFRAGALQSVSGTGRGHSAGVVGQ